MNSFSKPLLLLVLNFVLLQLIQSQKNMVGEYTKTVCVAFKGVNILTMRSNKLLSNQTLLAKNGFIVKIGSTEEIDIPDDFTIIHAEGKYLMPGLIDMHVHLSDNKDMIKFLAHGVTTVRNMSDVPWWVRLMGFSNIRRLKNRQKKGKIAGPGIYTYGFTLDGNPPVSPMNKRITNTKDARKEIQKEKKKKYDGIKLYDNLTLDAYKAIISEAKGAGITVAGHVPHAVPLETILSDQILSIEHFTGYINNKTGGYIIPENKIEEYLQLTREKNVYNVPTLAVWACMPPENGINQLKNDPKYKNLSWHVKWMWKTALPYYYKISYPDKERYTQHMLELTMDLAKRMYNAGCPLLIGTDTNIAGTYVGETTLLELELFVKCGIPAYETLRSATILPAMALGKAGELGTVETGKRANLILLDENPLDNISNIRKIKYVYCNGFLVNSEKVLSVNF